MKELVADLAVAFGILVVAVFCLFLLMIVTVAPLERKVCHEKWNRGNMESHYSIWTGCMIKHDGEWLPEDNYIVVEP